MDIVRCKNGHFYDCSKYPKCPHCGVGMEINRENEITQAGSSLREQSTVAKNNPAGTDPLREAKTEAHRGSDGVKTVGIYAKKLKMDPVVGWLVCIKGPEKGRDYRLHHGRNFIGRSAKMDVSIFEDDQISRDSHASVIYEPRKGDFILAGGEGTAVTLNGQAVISPEKLKDGDVISIGATELEFIAFCKGGTRWEEEL
jgi:ssDNA-binding Zn-finger/Zn-ribbon topoisomerase 1